MSLRVVDTDILSLYERGNPEVTRRILLADREQMAITVITVEEQIDGRFKKISAARTIPERETAYLQLAVTAQALGRLRILPFTAAAMARYESLWAMKLNVGKNDLRIAAMALKNNATVVTRNVRDFERVPGLFVEN